MIFINALRKNYDMNSINIEQMDLNLFKVFEALYEEGSASRAALRLGVTQSAVSASLGRLRKIFNDHLFTRTGRGLTPTRRAEEMKPVVSDALQSCRQSLSLARFAGNVSQERTLAIGWSDDYEIALGRTVIDQVHQAFPGVRLLFRQSHSKIAAEMLLNRQVDLIVSAPPEASSALKYENLGQGGYACLSARPLPTLSLEEYIARPHLLVSSGGIVGIVDEALSALSLKRHIEASTTHFSALPFLLMGTEALATLPRHAAHRLATVTGLVLHPCPLSLPVYSAGLGYRAESLRDPVIAAVATIVREQLLTLLNT